MYPIIQEVKYWRQLLQLQAVALAVLVEVGGGAGAEGVVG